MSTVLIVGCGDIGRRVARLHRVRGDRVIGVVRSQSSVNVLQREGIEPLLLDLDGLATSLPRADLVYHLAPPAADGDRDIRTARVLAWLPLPGRMVYISTSGVYGDRNGEWVDETTAPNPQSDRARRRLDAERELLTWGERQGVDVIILRVAGIYGPGRLPVDRLDRVVVVCPDQAPYSNRIHADDLATACLAAGERGSAGEIYNVSDDQPSSMTDYFYRVADARGKPRPACVPLSEARDHMSPGLWSFVRESRRMNNAKLKTLGIELRYPTLQQGIAASLEAEERQRD